MEGFERKKKLIVGLGNPGAEHNHTRHNIGFEVVDALAKKFGVSLAREKVFPANFGRVNYLNDDIFLFMPLTFMNASGKAVKRCIDFYKIPVKGILVIADDVELPFKSLRIRPKGRSGGHNGLKSIEEYLGTTEYSRLKIGVGYPAQIGLADHVLGKFTEEETSVLSDVIQNAQEMVLQWLQEPLSSFTKQLEGKTQVNKNNP